MSTINHMVTKIEADMVDTSSALGPRDYFRGTTTITVKEWRTNPNVQYFAVATATIPLHWLPPSVQDLWARFEAGVIAHIQEANAKNP